VAKRLAPKRLFRNNDFVSFYEGAGSPHKRMKRMASENLDVLQNIEFALVTTHREYPAVDDSAVAEALRCAIRGKEPSEETAELLLSRLGATRQIRPDISDSVWQEGLQVILGSVKRRSKLRPGETSYLDFVADYIK
jgi:hypothetical protein